MLNVMDAHPKFRETPHGGTKAKYRIHSVRIKHLNVQKVEPVFYEDLFLKEVGLGGGNDYSLLKSNPKDQDVL